jgi:tight adherence protein C
MLPRRAAQEDAGASLEASRAGGVVLPTPPTETPTKAPSTKISIRERLIHAGFYRENLLPLLRLTRVLLLGLIIAAGYLLSLTGAVTLKTGLTLGLLGSGFAALAPSFFLDYLKARRQMAMRRALPDALDVIVVALEGGLPVAASFRRVASELAGVHPLLATELTIVQREVQMGRSLGQAMHNLAARFDLDDLRNMASVIQQSERYGSSVTRAFRIFADGLRTNRVQQAEEMARKASVKLIFPTVIFIFPVMFVVILAPAVIQLSKTLQSFNTPTVLP